MPNQSIPPRLLAEQLIGVDNLFQLDKADLGVFSRAGLRAKQKNMLALEAENKNLRGILAATLASFPFHQRFRFVHRALAVPTIMPGRAHENVLRRCRRGVVRAQRLVAQGKHPAPVMAGADAEGAETGSVQKQHGGLASYSGTPFSAAKASAEQAATFDFWERIRFVPACTPTSLSDLPAELREFILRGVREFKRQSADADIDQQHVALCGESDADGFHGILQLPLDG